MRSMLLGAAALFMTACASNEAELPPAAPAPAPPSAERVVESPPAADMQSMAAPGVSVAPDPPPPPARDGDVVVQGTRPLPAPGPADTRTVTQRMSDIRAWDTCVMRAQDAGESDPTRPALDTPEEICSRSLGMADRLAVPAGGR